MEDDFLKYLEKYLDVFCVNPTGSQKRSMSSYYGRAIRSFPSSFVFARKILSVIEHGLTQRAHDGIGMYTDKELAEEFVKRGYKGRLEPRL